jgi:long-chain acyl-CoA synthetase
MRTLREAISQVSAPGEVFETRERAGVREFLHAPESLCDIYDGARGEEKTFLVFRDDSWSFARVIEEADLLSGALVNELGVSPGDRVALLMRNRPEWIVAFAAVTRFGAVAVALNAWWSSEEVDYALQYSEPRVLVVDEAHAELGVRLARPRGIAVVVVGGVDESIVVESGAWRYPDLLSRRHSAPTGRPGKEDLATMMFTSGTTGRPKGAVSTHGAIIQSLMAFSAGLFIEALRQSERDHPPSEETTLILLVPLFHVTGCIPVMLSSFTWHFTLVITTSWDPEEALQLIARHRVTHVVGVPTQVYDLIHSPSFEVADLSSVARLGGGGAPTPAALVERVETRLEHGRPNLGYGLTETNAYGPQNYGDDYVARPSSTGQTPTIVMDVEIRSSLGTPCATGEVGEIWVNGPTLFSAYWRHEEATREALVDGWFRTGDLGYLDDEGFLYVVDRTKDMIIRAGENVYSAEVEAVLEAHPRVARAVVVGVSDDRLGQRVVAVIVARPGEDVSAEDLEEFARQHLASYQVPSEIVITQDPLPMTSTGKVRKDVVRRRYF